MDDKRWERIAALAGIVFVVFNAVGAVAQGAPPSSDDTDQEVLDWFLDNDSKIALSSALAALSIIALVWWFGTLWRRMVSAEHGSARLSVVALAGLAGSGAMFGASTGVLAATAIQSDSMSPEIARLMYVLSITLLSFAGAFLVAHLAAVNALSIRSGLFPKWITGVGMLAALGFLISAVVGVTTDADAGMIFGFLGFIVWMVWIVAVSVTMWRTDPA